MFNQDEFDFGVFDKKNIDSRVSFTFSNIYLNMNSFFFSRKRFKEVYKQLNIIEHPHSH